jgi:hypothetical protein
VDRLEVGFADFAIAHILLDSVISESLHHEGEQTLDTAQCIRTLTEGSGEGVRIQEVADAMGIPYKRAAERVQEAEHAGLIHQANAPEVRNVKRFVATSPQQLLPDPKELFQKVRLNTPCSFHHPLTGELVVYQPETSETGKLVAPVPRTVTVPETELPTPERASEPTQVEPPPPNPKAAEPVKVTGCPPIKEAEEANPTAETRAYLGKKGAANTVQKPLKPGMKYEVRPAPWNGFGVYEVGSTELLQWHPTTEAAWEAIDAVSAGSSSVA